MGCGTATESVADKNGEPVITTTESVIVDGGSFGANSEAAGGFLDEDFWRVEDAEKEKVRFSTGLEVVYPENWQGNIVLREEGGTLAFCEKGNADAGIGGDLFYLCLLEHTQDRIMLSDWSKVLGLYKQGDREYVLVQDFPGDRQYSEDNQSLIEAYLGLSGSMENVIIKVNDMEDFTECGASDVNFVDCDESPEAVLSVDSEQVKEVVEEFAAAYFSGDVDTVKSLLPDSYAWNIEVYEGTGTISEITVKGLPDAGEQEVGSVLTISMQYRDSTYEDMFQYLTFELKKQSAGWEIQFYGVEG